jgi:Transcription initiation factor IIA, gamma subunit
MPQSAWPVTHADCESHGRQSTCRTLENEVTAKTTFKGKLDTYRFCDNVRLPMRICASRAASLKAERSFRARYTPTSLDMSFVLLRFCALFWSDCLGDRNRQVWTFLVSDATFKTSATGSGSTVSAPEVHVDKVKIIAVRPTSPARIPEACFLVTTTACLDFHKPSGRLGWPSYVFKNLQAGCRRRFCYASV